MGAARDSGQLLDAFAANLGLAYIETRAGDHAAAEAALRTGILELNELGDRSFYPTLLTELAHILVERGSDDEAAAVCATAREAAASVDLATLASVEGLEGLLLARRGELEEGERKARNAVELLSESDFYASVSDAKLLLARTLLVCGRPDEARAVAGEALAICEAKGDRPAAGWARELLSS